MRRTIRQIGGWLAFAGLIALFVWGGVNIWEHGADLPVAKAPPTSASSSALRYSATLAAGQATPGSMRVALAGNSIAVQLGPAFKQLDNVSVFDLGNIGCTFPTSVTALYRHPITGQIVRSAPCDPQREVEALQIFKPRVVFWLASDAPPPWEYHGHTLTPCSPTYDAVYKRDLVAEVSADGSSGATVVLATEGYVRGQARAVVPLPDSTVDCNNKLRREVAQQTGAKLVDLFSYACPRGVCDPSLRSDGLHYTSVAAARWLLSEAQ